MAEIFIFCVTTIFTQISNLEKSVYLEKLGDSKLLVQKTHIFRIWDFKKNGRELDFVKL